MATSDNGYQKIYDDKTYGISIYYKKGDKEEDRELIIQAESVIHDIQRKAKYKDKYEGIYNSITNNTELQNITDNIPMENVVVLYSDSGYARWITDDNGTSLKGGKQIISMLQYILSGGENNTAFFPVSSARYKMALEEIKHATAAAPNTAEGVAAADTDAAKPATDAAVAEDEGTTDAADADAAADAATNTNTGTDANPAADTAAPNPASSSKSSSSSKYSRRGRSSRYRCSKTSNRCSSSRR